MPPPTLNSIKADLITLIGGLAFPILAANEDRILLLNRADDILIHNNNKVLTLDDLSLTELVRIAVNPVTPFSRPPFPWAMDFDDLWDRYFPTFSKPHAHSCIGCNQPFHCRNARCKALPLYAHCTNHERFIDDNNPPSLH